MNYADAIVWLKEHDVKKDDGTYYEFGEASLSFLVTPIPDLSAVAVVQV